MITFKRVSAEIVEVYHISGGDKIAHIERRWLPEVGNNWTFIRGPHFTPIGCGTLPKAKKVAREQFKDYSHPIDQQFGQALVGLEQHIERILKRKWPLAYTVELKAIQHDIDEFKKRYYERANDA